MYDQGHITYYEASPVLQDSGAIAVTTTQPLVLLVEDDPASGRLMKALLEPLGCRVSIEGSGSRALAGMRDELPQLVFLDLGLTDMHGLAVLERIRGEWPAVPVIILTGDTGVPSAVKAIQLGALNYFTKPINTQQVEAAARGALERSALLSELNQLRGQLQDPGLLARQMGASPAVQHLQDQVKQVAATQFTVLVQGETGAGKELVARAVHDYSGRSKGAFIALDCGAIPEALLESELFGYERGAFSGADRRREGHFQLAQGGTLFLDEIANLPFGLQAKLLRVLQERQLQPLGGGKPVALDVRFVAASNHDLEKEAAAGRFRQDLFFRLAEFRVSIPALRERPEDIAPLAQRFLEETGVELRRPVRGLDPDALALLQSHAWPGNVRELRNVIRQCVLQCQGFSLSADDVARVLKPLAQGRQGGGPAAAAGATLTALGQAAREGAERQAIGDALRESKGNILRASKQLGVDNKTLHVKLKKYRIRARDFEPSAEG
jgi:DNA-binding NtrC family response regulator